MSSATRSGQIAVPAMTAQPVEAMVQGGTAAKRVREERRMEPTTIAPLQSGYEIDEDVLVHAWRTEQPGRLGLSRLLAEAFADMVDWRAIAEPVGRGCPPELALRIAL
jgi:hypothetical protein